MGELIVSRENELKIDPEFKNLIPPLQDDEFKQLEENILSEGCRDPLTVWGNILIDGHNRYDICKKHDIPFRTIEREFDSRDDAIIWIIKNQFGRRNLSAYDRARLALKLKPIIVEQAKKRQVRKSDFVPKKSWEQRKQEEIESLKPMFDNKNPVSSKLLDEAASNAASKSIRNERMSDETHIYFAKIDEDKMKVGSSAFVESRIQQLKVSAPKIELVEDVWFGPNARKFENTLKKRFNEYLISGEVYKYSEAILAEMLAYTKRQISRMNETDTIIAEAAGVSSDTIAKVEKIETKAKPEIKEQLRSGQISINQAYQQVRREEKETAREEQRQENAEKIETLATPLEAQGLFQTIVIDPPWDWGDEGDVNQFGRAKPDYHTMPIEEIENLPVGKIADDNCHLYLWVTNRSLPKAFRLIDAWGFRYITCLTWVKPSIGMGNYFRGSTEQVLFAVKGSQPLKRRDVGTHFEAPRGDRHSAKPDEFYHLVESCSYGPYIDIFGRKGRDGWSVWGENG